ncbi:MAG TPA: flagellar export chaperone FliS [Acidimicrobiales bacterium]|jgi:flagellar protein FliS|nr:flagellar export chaperone FliS [Acidimicrobiales bacterium]
MSSRTPASAYQEQAVTTANGPQLLLMLCDRLAVDIARADAAMESRDFKTTNESLQHAQQIVRMLRLSLNPDGFRGGQELLAVYVFLENHLIKANLEKSVDVVRECATLVHPIHEAWRRAVSESERTNGRTNVG